MEKKTKQRAENSKGLCHEVHQSSTYSLVFGLRSHVEGNQAVDGPSHSQRHGGPVKHLVGKASLQVDGHTVSLLQSKG